VEYTESRQIDVNMVSSVRFSMLYDVLLRCSRLFKEGCSTEIGTLV